MADSNGPAISVRSALEVVAAGFHVLEGRKQEVNDLNVYPVPDGDTGTNLALTVKSILEDLQRAPSDLTPPEVCNAISEAALMGARGNSGVILSQMVRGAMEALSEAPVLEPAVLVACLHRATEASYRAIRKPVEGTMLTVLREMAEAAEELCASDGAPPPELFEEVLREGWESVRRTPALLSVLAEAGVVDAGGFGLVLILEGLLLGGSGGEFMMVDTSDLAVMPHRDEAEEHAASKYTYCTSFLVKGSDLDAEDLEALLSPLGDSLLVVGSTAQLKVHVHTDAPGEVLNLATGLGTLHVVEIDNMKEQTAERDRRLRAQEAAASPVSALTQVVAVVNGEGNKALFSSMGADILVEGGQTMNPSAEELINAVKQASAPSVIILPNNKNIILAAEQIVGRVEREVFVVPTRSLLAGLSALVVFDSETDGASNHEEMRAAIAGVSSGEVTRAVRASSVNGLAIEQGAFIGLVNDEVIATGQKFDVVVDAVAATMVNGTSEVMTVLLGNGEDAEPARLAAERLRERYSDLEVEIHVGGQPLYPLLVSVE